MTVASILRDLDVLEDVRKLKAFFCIRLLQEASRKAIIKISQ